MKKLSSKDFFVLVRKLELEEFPEMKPENRKPSMGLAGLVCDSEFRVELGDNYVYFVPSWHVKNRLITQEDIDKLRKEGKALLSVGSGPSYLERLLVYRFNVPRENVVLSDISPQHIPKGFLYHPFDMYSQWPEFGRFFDYIISPESISTLFSFEISPKIQIQRAIHLFEQSLKNLNPTGQVRFGSYFHKSGRKIFQTALEAVKSKYPSANLFFHYSRKGQHEGTMILKRK